MRATTIEAVYDAVQTFRRTRGRNPLRREIAMATMLSYETVAKALELLEARGKLTVRKGVSQLPLTDDERHAANNAAHRDQMRAWMQEREGEGT